MIDLSLYDYLEKYVSEKEYELKKNQQACGCDIHSVKLGINALQSIVRTSFSEEQDETASYSRIIYQNNQLVSIKFQNLKFDLNSVVSILSNLPGIAQKEIWAMLMTVLSIVSELSKIKVPLSPEMAWIVLTLYREKYRISDERSMCEDELENQFTEEFSSQYNEQTRPKYASAITDLDKLHAIKLENGRVTLIEEISI